MISTPIHQIIYSLFQIRSVVGGRVARKGVASLRARPRTRRDGRATQLVYHRPLSWTHNLNCTVYSETVGSAKRYVVIYFSVLSLAVSWAYLLLFFIRQCTLSVQHQFLLFNCKLIPFFYYLMLYRYVKTNSCNLLKTLI